MQHKINTASGSSFRQQKKDKKKHINDKTKKKLNDIEEIL